MDSSYLCFLFYEWVVHVDSLLTEVYSPSHICALYSHTRRRIRRTEGNATALRLKSKLQKDFAAAVCLFEASSPPRILSWERWARNFVGSESGEIHECKVLKNMVSNMTQHPPPLSDCWVELETTPLNISWSKFQEKITNVLASSLLNVYTTTTM